MRKEKCDTCKFWAPNGELSEATEGECRRRSPAPYVSQKYGFDVDASWPTTSCDDWCGEWRVLLTVVSFPGLLGPQKPEQS